MIYTANKKDKPQELYKDSFAKVIGITEKEWKEKNLADEEFHDLVGYTAVDMRIRMLGEQEGNEEFEQSAYESQWTNVYADK